MTGSATTSDPAEVGEATRELVDIVSGLGRGAAPAAADGDAAASALHRRVGRNRPARPEGRGMNVQPAPERQDAGSDRSLGAEPTRHEVAVARTSRWADGSAARGDYAGALEWIALIESIDGELPKEYETKRQTWSDEIG